MHLFPWFRVLFCFWHQIVKTIQTNKVFSFVHSKTTILRRHLALLKQSLQDVWSFKKKVERARGGSCRTPHHRQEGLLPHAAPQTSGPIATCPTTDKWRFCRTTGKSAYLPFSLPHCKQVRLTQLTANQTENTGGGGDSQRGSDRYARPKDFGKP